MAPRRPRFSHPRTAWHPQFVVLLEQVLSASHVTLIDEFRLSREPQRIDVVLVRRADAGELPPPLYLRAVLDDLAEHTLIHFKGPTDALEADDASMLLAYAAQYLVVAGVAAPSSVAVRVVAPRVTPRFERQARSLGAAFAATARPGVYDGRWGPFGLRLVETSVAHSAEREGLLYALSPQFLRAPEGIAELDPEEFDLFLRLAQSVEQFYSDPRRRPMKDVDTANENMRTLFEKAASLLPPARRLAGLSAAQRLEGIPEHEALLAMPDAVVRALSEEYVASLPEPARSELRRRRGER